MVAVCVVVAVLGTFTVPTTLPFTLTVSIPALPVKKYWYLKVSDPMPLGMEGVLTEPFLNTGAGPFITWSILVAVAVHCKPLLPVQTLVKYPEVAPAAVVPVIFVKVSVPCE